MSFSNSAQWYAIWDSIRDTAFPQAGTYRGYSDSGPWFFWTDLCQSSYPKPVNNISVSTGDTVYVTTAVGSFQGGNNEEFLFQNLTRNTYVPLYENCSFSTAGAAGEFVLEVNDNLGTNGWGSFTNFAEDYSFLSSPNQSGYAGNFNYTVKIIQWNSALIADPSLPDSSGDYTMYYA
jgi:hypothetical protein